MKACDQIKREKDAGTVACFRVTAITLSLRGLSRVLEMLRVQEPSLAAIQICRS